MGMLKTRKMYYEKPTALRHPTAFVRRSPVTLALAETVAFPEGGGQAPDTGVIVQDGRTLRFRDTQKKFTRLVMVDGKSIEVDGEIQITLDEAAGPEWDEGRPIEVVVDAERRAKLTRSHTAAHLVYAGMLDVLPGFILMGCQIEEGGGRFDFRLDEKLTPEQVAAVGKVAHDWQAADAPITLTSHPVAPDCRMWECRGLALPCGGCHLTSTGPVGSLQLQRRGKGKGQERIYYTLTDPLPPAVLATFATEV